MSNADDRPRASPRGYACGKRTRARIISAALQVFGEHGYDRASTRQIAARAGVNAPAIHYYFGSKQELYAACTRHVIGRVSSMLALPVVHARAVLRTAEPTAALDALCELLAALVDGLVVAGSEIWGRYPACVAGDGAGEAEALLYEHIGTRLFATVSRLIAAATGRSARGKLTRLQACLLLGQVRSLHEHRTRTLAVMGWLNFDEHTLALIKAVVRDHTRGALAASRVASTPVEAHQPCFGWARPGR
jgi:AcrR family transcriptional regulator